MTTQVVTIGAPWLCDLYCLGLMFLAHPFNPSHAAGDYGNAVLKLALAPQVTPAMAAPNGWGLSVVDYFVP